MKKWLVFDVMGVIFQVGDDNNVLLVPYIQRENPSLTREYINEVYMQASLGLMTSQQFWAEMGFRDEYPAIEKDYLDSCLLIDPCFVEIAKEMAADFNIALLSNDISEWSAYLRKKHQFEAFLSETVISGDVGYRKPSPDIYQILLERIQADPNDCIFIDDRSNNLMAAKAAGMKTVYFLREPKNDDYQAEREIYSFMQLPIAIQNL